MKAGEHVLTRKQEGFAQDVAAGKTQTDAYRANYDTQTTNDETVYPEASRVAANRKVSARIKEHVDKAFDGVSVREYVLGKLKAQLESGKNEGAKMQAAKLLGMTEGMYREVIEDSESHKTMAELLLQAAGDDPAKVLALKQVLDLDDDAETTH